MKYFLSFLLIFLAFSSFAQEPAYTPMNSNYKFKGIRVDSLFLIPSFTDTNSANTQRCASIAGSMIRTGNDFWMRNAAKDGWLQNVNIGGGASPVLSFVNEIFKKSGTDSVFYVISPHDTTFGYKDKYYDTISLSNRINTKIDSLKRNSDSVYFKKNGVWYFGYKDSIGAGGGTDSPDRINGQGTKNIVSDMNGFDLSIIELDELEISDTLSDKIRLYRGEVTLTSVNKIELNTDTIDISTTKIITPNGNIYESLGRKNDCTAISTFTINAPGVYNLYNTTIAPTTVNMPNPATFPGGVIYIINPDASPLPFGGSYLPIDVGGATYSQPFKTSLGYVSDGYNWTVLLQ